MRWLAVLLMVLLAIALMAGPGCTLGEDSEANASNGAEVEGEAAPEPSGTEFTLDIGGGGGGVFAVDMFVKIDGIDGESKDEKHEKWIDILSFSHGVSLPGGSLSVSTGRSAERATHGDFTMVKTIDKATPKLYLYCSNGQHIPSVKFELCRAGGDKETYMEYEMTDVIVSSVSTETTVQGGEALPIEEVSFRYGKIVWTYTEFDDTGKAKGQVESFFDVFTNTGG